MLYHYKIMYTLWLVVASRYGVTSGDLFLRITKGVRDNKETITFRFCVFYENMRDPMHIIPLDLRKCTLLIVINMYLCECDILIRNMIF